MTGKPGLPFLSYGRQTIEDDDVAAVVAALKSDFLTTGPRVGEFETAFARRVGAKYAVACNSGTAALHLATLALGLGPGDVAIVPSMTFLATANAVRFTGAEVAFADIDPESGLLTAETLRQALKSGSKGKPKAVLPVHLAGMVADMDAIAKVAAEAGLAMIEDACHALGAEAHGRKAGDCARSQAAAFSTHPVKTITTGEGGVLTTNDAAFAALARRFRSHGMDYDSAHWTNPDADKNAPWYYEMAQPGFNYRLTDIACALGLSQLKKLDRFLKRRAELAARYDRLLAPLAPHVKAPVRGQGNPAWHLYAVRIDFGALKVTRATAMQNLRAVGIGTQVHYIPVHTQPYYHARYGALSLPGAETYYRRTLSLPLFPTMQDGDIDRVVASLKTALGMG